MNEQRRQLSHKIMADKPQYGITKASLNGKLYDLYDKDALLSYIKDLSHAGPFVDGYKDHATVQKQFPFEKLLTTDDIIGLMHELNEGSVIKNIVEHHFLNKEMAQKACNTFAKEYYSKWREFAHHGTFGLLYSRFYTIFDTAALNEKRTAFYKEFQPLYYKDKIYDENWRSDIWYENDLASSIHEFLSFMLARVEPTSMNEYFEHIGYRVDDVLAQQLQDLMKGNSHRTENLIPSFIKMQTGVQLKLRPF